MRFLFLVLCFVAQHCAAQQDSIKGMQYPVKGFVKLNSEKLKINGFSYADSNHLVLYMPGNNIINGVYTYKGDVRTLQQRTIAIKDLQLLKVKRQSFIKGAAVGGLVGFGAGYLIGSITYNDDFSLLEDENDRRKSNHRLITSLGVGIPSALTGGLMGGIFIKKRFRVNGNAMQLMKAINKIYR